MKSHFKAEKVNNEGQKRKDERRDSLSAAVKVKMSLGRTSTISSATMKMREPSLRAMEMASFAVMVVVRGEGGGVGKRKEVSSA